MAKRALLTVLAIGMGCFSAQAQESDEVAQLTKPSSWFSLGLGSVNRDNQRFGMYNGLGKQGAGFMGSFMINRRDEDTGTWLRLSGSNLGLQTPELRLEHERQGHWGYFVDFNRIQRVTPYTINSNVAGLGNSTVTVPPVNPTGAGSFSTYTFKTERDRARLGFNYFLLPNLEFKLTFQNEEKNGRRLFGRGTTGGTAGQEFLAEPINSTTRQVDAVLDYTGERFQLSAGYYGSFYNNHNTVLNVKGGAVGFNAGVGSTGVAFDNIALPPDNQSHQLHVTGAYQFDKTTRATLKISKSVGLQNDPYMAVRFFGTANNGASANQSGRGDLGGRLDTTLVNLGVTSRPLTGLFLNGSLRYEDRKDKTPIALYNTTVGGTGIAPIFTPLPATSSSDGYNEPRSLTYTQAKVEGSYQLPAGLRASLGLEREDKRRSMSGIRVVSYREKTTEDSVRVEIKRAIADSLSGSIALFHAVRGGTDYRNLVTADGLNNYPSYSARNCGATLLAGTFNVTRCGLIQPIYMADRVRDKLRVLADWAPDDNWSFQAVLEDARDDYGNGRGNPDIGVRDGWMRLYSLDAAYTFNDNWKLTAWMARSYSGISQATISNPGVNATAVLWSSGQSNKVDTFGVGLRGKMLGSRASLGADYLFSDDKTSYSMSREQYAPFTSAVGPGSLPDIKYRHQQIKLFGDYKVDKKTTVRLDYIFDLLRADDWTWQNWIYTDGTRITQDPVTKVHFLGISTVFSF